jgi:hypothetical protein
MHAVGAMMQGAEQGEQILHMLAAIQAFDIDRLEAQSGALRRISATSASRWLRARTSTAMLAPAPPPGLADEASTWRASSPAASPLDRDDRMHDHRCRPRRLGRRRFGIAHGAGLGAVGGREDARERRH